MHLDLDATGTAPVTVSLMLAHQHAKEFEAYHATLDSFFDGEVNFCSEQADSRHENYMYNIYNER
jgi:hypothetical protein